jgi:hypothetical protein
MEAAQILKTVLPDPILWSGESAAEVARKARPVFEEHRVCRIASFPLDPDFYLDFLRQFGEPLANYSSLSDLDKDDPHPEINRVKFKLKNERSKDSVHYISGALPPHSARSWRSPRPNFFAMLMVDPGWRDLPPGARGESILLPWEEMFAALAERDGPVFERHLQRLCRTPLRFAANNVREPLSSQPLCYPLPGARGRFDLGVRLKQDLLAKIELWRDQFEDFEAYRESLEFLVQCTKEEQFQRCFAMERGDLVMIDNHRFAHGRRSIVGERNEPEGMRTNPRELWSVTVQ